MEAVFRAPSPYRWVVIAIPAYSENEYAELAINRKPQCVGVEYFRACFCDGREHDELILHDARDILDMRAYIKRNEGFIEVSCDKEAAMLGGGCQTKRRDHNQHIKDLQEKYGDGEDDTELSEWDRKHLNKMLGRNV